MRSPLHACVCYVSSKITHAHAGNCKLAMLFFFFFFGVALLLLILATDRLRNDMASGLD